MVSECRIMCTVAVIAQAAAICAAEWIAGDYVRPESEQEFFDECPNDVVRCRFKAHGSKVKEAAWKVAAPGLRDLFVNGKRVSPTALPPWTPYDRRIIEERFDVAGLLVSGSENELMVELGNGWWNLLPLKMWYKYPMWNILPQGVPSVRATLEIVYEDGGRQQIETDGRWQASKGRVVKNSIYLGVREDARRKAEGWKPARCVAGPKGAIVPAEGFPKTVVYSRWKAKEVKQVAKGVWRIDFGANFAGTFKATLRGVPEGSLVKFRSGERLNDDGTVNVMTAVAGQIKNPDRGPLFDVAEQRDEWISDGAEIGTFEPRLTFHCFRYIQVEGLPSAPKAGDFEAQAWSADVKEGAHFECSNPKLNLLHEVCRRTFRANLQSVQSDCPGREKFGYGGDLACTAESFRCNWAMHAFYRKMLRDFLDEASYDGLFTETAPYVGIGSRAVIPPEETGGRAAAPMGWAVGVPVLLDVLVRYDGDLDAVREAYPALMRYIDILSRRYPNDDIPQCLGDWCAEEKADCGLSCLAHWHEFLAKTAKFARLLGREAAAGVLKHRADRVAAKFRERYVRDSGRVNAGVQGEQLFALYHNLLDKKDIPAARDILSKDIAAHGYALTTGIFGTQYLFEYLSANGEAELAGKVAVHEGAPGYLWMLDRGATTLWECWGEDKCRNVHSNCHPMFGSVEQWFMRYVLGIAVCEDAVGCDRVRIAPHAVAGVTSASGWLDTPKGRISVSWKLADGKIAVEKSVPAGVQVVE